MANIEMPKQNNVSDSLMNIYEETKQSRAGSSFESSNLASSTTDSNIMVYDDNVMTNMSKTGKAIE